MSFSNNGQRRGSFGGDRRGGFGGGRPRFNQQRGPRPAFIHPSRYVNKAAPIEEQPPYIATNTFADFGFDPAIVANVTSHGYTTPTPIQDQAIPHLMQGRDVVGIANTGTGKTAAFLLPLINKIAHDFQEGGLIVVPTRELATQIYDEFRLFSKGLRMNAVLCVGGLSIDPQVRVLRQNPHVVIGTPGRLKDLMMRGALDVSMFRTIILDEVDRMLDIGFIKDIRFLIAGLPTPRQSLFFSATMNAETQSVMQSFLIDPVTVSVRSEVTNEHIDQDVVRVEPGKNKVDMLYDLLMRDEFEKVIVFGRTKHGIDKIEEILTHRGMRVVAIHGNKSQNLRQRALDNFKAGRVRALLATDVAARGIDVDHVTHVINFDEPNSYEDYVHRIGRTGRAGRIGKALTFVG